jgi:hypothetical protein
MSDQRVFIIRLYVEGVVMENALRGEIEYLQAKIFLDTATEVRYRLEQLPRPIPDPSRDFYALTDAQFAAYQPFLDRLEENRPRQAEGRGGAL